MKIAIIDDEQYWRDYVKENVEKFYENDCQIDMYENGEEFLTKNRQYQIVFMDIEMKKMDGFETLKKYGEIYKDTISIILTTHTEMSRKGYRVNAFRYVDKQDLEELCEALESSREKLLRDHVIRIQAVVNEEVSLKCSDIYYMETFSPIISIYTKSGEIQSRNGMDELEQELQQIGFYRSHRSYLLNMAYVQSFTRTDIFLVNGMKVPLSRRKYSDFKTTYLNWKFATSNA